MLNCLLKGLYEFVLPPTVHKLCHFPIFLLTPGSASLFNFCQSDLLKNGENIFKHLFPSVFLLQLIACLGHCYLIIFLLRHFLLTLKNCLLGILTVSCMWQIFPPLYCLSLVLCVVFLVVYFCVISFKFLILCSQIYWFYLMNFSFYA